MEILARENGSAKVSLSHQPNLSNPYGMMHGGAIVSLADTAMACAILSLHPDQRFYTAQLKINFKAPVKSGLIFAEARIKEKKQKFLFGEVVIRDESGAVIAESLVKFYLENKPIVQPTNK